MNNPFISIITPTKNSEITIKNTLHSVAIQNYKYFEHIIIDSESTDNTINIIKSYSNAYPIKYISEKDSGISDAFNKGIRISSGKWIIFLGSGDELYNSNTLSEMKYILKEKDDKLIVWGNIIYKDQKGNIGRLVKGDFHKKKLKRYMCLPHQAAFHNRKIFDMYGLFDTKIKIAMDYELCLRIYNDYKFDGYVNKIISYMLIGGQSQVGYSCIKDFMIIQRKYNIWEREYFPYALYIWAKFKILVKGIMCTDHDFI